MRGVIPILMATLALPVSNAWSAERVTLRNGFDVNCDHHALVEGRERLYLNAAEGSYIDLSPQEIASVEYMTDPPTPPLSAQDAAKPLARSTSDAKLSKADLGEILARAGRDHNLDVDLLASIVKAESGGNPHAVSHAGARGLMQLMPATATELGVQDTSKPDQNVRGGSTYLDMLLTQYHDNLALALAAYNAGPAAVDRYHGIPPFHETRAYVARVIHEFNCRVRAREAGLRHSAVPTSSPSAAE
jgi:hypothetical protein